MQSTPIFLQRNGRPEKVISWSRLMKEMIANSSFEVPVLLAFVKLEVPHTWHTP